MLQTLENKTLLPLASGSPFTIQTTTGTTVTNVRIENRETAYIMPDLGPVSKAYHIPPRRGKKIAEQNRTSTTPPPPLKDKSDSGILDAANVHSQYRIIMPRQRKKGQERVEQQSTTSTPATKSFSHQTSLDAACAIEPGSRAHKGASVSFYISKETETKPELKPEAVNPALLQQRRDHWRGLHIGRDPYGLASKPYLDAGLPPPWQRCDSCEEEMVWLQKKR